MEFIRGKYTFSMDATDFATRSYGYKNVLVDLGTGDGRYVQYVAQRCPAWFVIGIDACRENLVEVSRKSLPNALYLVANAEALPWELSGVANHITVNFPWGSLLTGLLEGGSRVFDGLRLIAQPGAMLEIRVNSSALVQEGLSLQQGGEMVERALRMSGFHVELLVTLGAEELRNCPTTWAKRLASGRDPLMLHIRAVRPESQEHFWTARQTDLAIMPMSGCSVQVAARREPGCH